MENIIKLNNFGKTLSSRPLARTIFQSVNENTLVIVDFSNVEEVTPSFCHEMLTILLKNKIVKVQIINTNDFVKVQINKALMSIEQKNI